MALNVPKETGKETPTVTFEKGQGESHFRKPPIETFRVCGCQKNMDAQSSLMRGRKIKLHGALHRGSPHKGEGRIFAAEHKALVARLFKLPPLDH